MAFVSSILSQFIQSRSSKESFSINSASTKSPEVPPNFQKVTQKINSINSSVPNYQLLNPQRNNRNNLTTRSRPKYSAFKKIIKQKRGPKKTQKMEPTQTTTIATQTEEETNKGLGKAALRPQTSNPIYSLINLEDMPQYRKNLCWRRIPSGGNRKGSPNGPKYQINWG